MNRLLFYLFGSLSFKAWGGFPERFLNLCRVKGVRVHALKSENGVLYAETSLAGFRKIRRCASGSGMKIKIMQKKGLPFVYKRIAERTGLFAGIALCIFLLFFYSRSVWLIEVTGNEKLGTEAVLEVLGQNGAEPGALKYGIDTKQLCFSLYEALPEIAWVNIGLDGSRMTVNLREVTQKPQQRGSETPCNIVAQSDGVIALMRVYKGEAMVQEGDGVRAGELLVSGVVAHEQAKRNTFLGAHADIFAYTKKKNTFTVPKRYRTRVFTGRQKDVYALHIFRFQLPLYLFAPHYGEEEVTTVEKPIIIRGKPLPISLKITRVREMKGVTRTPDENSAGSIAATRKQRFESAFGEDTKILKVHLKQSQTPEEYVFTFEYQLYENIAKRRMIILDEKNVDNPVENSG